MSKVLTGVQDDRIFFKPVRKPDPPKYDSSQPEKMEVEVMFNIYYSLSTDEPVQWVHNMICKYAQLHMSQFQSISRLYARWHSNIIIYVFQIRITSFTSLILSRCSSTRSELSNTRIESPSLVKSVASLESPGPRFKLQNHCYAKHNHMWLNSFDIQLWTQTLPGVPSCFWAAHRAKTSSWRSGHGHWLHWESWEPACWVAFLDALEKLLLGSSFKVLRSSH